MESVLVSAATGALKAVTVKLATLLGDEFKNMKDVRKEIKPLSDELNYMHAFLEKMSEEENPDKQDKRWMTDVREMSYDIEDSLDDFMICIDDDKSAKKKSLMKKCTKLLDKMKAHKRISKAIQEFKTQIKEVGDRNHRYRTGVTTTKDSHEMIDIRAQAIFKDASELVAIDEQKNELINLLIEDGSLSQHQVKVVAIVGLGGLGKTTLANQVYESLKDKFDCKAFVTVSRTPHMLEVLRTILLDISGQEYTGDMQHLIRKISDFLQDKRYLIVVDDLWDSESWEAIQNAFIKNSCASRIIITTRKIEVAQSCCTLRRGHIYKLRPLNPKNSRKLFLKRIFGLEEGCPSDLSEVCDDILKKCDGLPLAIIAIAGLLAGKAPTVDEWNKVQCSFGHALERHSDVNRMIQILSLSYFDLPPHLRSCLLYLSLFPEDYEIRKDRLILRWIAEGFVHEEHGFTQYEIGDRCFNELINRSLIQPVDSDYFDVICCRVHDTILEFILSKAVEENFVTLFGLANIRVDPDRKIRRLSLQDRNEVSDAIVGSREKIIYYHVRAVVVFPGCLDSLPSLQKLKHLRVLDLEGCKALQAHHLTHLGRLFALRYLNFRNTCIDELPEEIGELQYLQTLDIRGTYIKELSSSVGRLSRLVTLLCDPFVRLPDGFGKNMQALQQLMGSISVCDQSPSFAQELRQLRNLRILEISFDDEVSEDLMSSLCTLGMGCLNSLVIECDEKQMKWVMEPWSPTPHGLKILQISWIVVPRVPRWIRSLVNLQDLRLHVEQLGVADFGLLGSLNALSSLCLPVNKVADRWSSTQGTQRVKINGTHGFRNLRRFQVGSGDCAFGLLFEGGAMPNLQELFLSFNSDLTGSLTNAEFDFGIQHLPCLALVGYYFSNYHDPEHPAWVALEKAASSNPNHPKLHYN
ncbi:disease resistance protein RGA5-like [Miscanthus floridulus]|uniref:disease resistance protein RGA5-like n=1 Tax=Miscanthus floridulus TaxID=154761 RepID=UPI00345A8617